VFCRCRGAGGLDGACAADPCSCAVAVVAILVGFTFEPVVEQWCAVGAGRARQTRVNKGGDAGRRFREDRGVPGHR
jgi:hypothetical protein